MIVIALNAILLLVASVALSMSIVLLMPLHAAFASLSLVALTYSIDQLLRARR